MPYFVVCRRSGCVRLRKVEDLTEAEQAIKRMEKDRDTFPRVYEAESHAAASRAWHKDYDENLGAKTKRG